MPRSPQKELNTPRIEPSREVCCLFTKSNKSYREAKRSELVIFRTNSI